MSTYTRRSRALVQWIPFVLALDIALVLATPMLAQNPNPVGEWNLQSDAQGQVSVFTLTVTKEGETLKAKVASEQYGNQNLSDFKYENGVMTYTRTLDAGGQAIALLFKGKIEGDKLTGTYTVQGLEIPVTGSRKAATPGK